MHGRPLGFAKEEDKSPLAAIQERPLSVEIGAERAPEEEVWLTSRRWS
jgi:hypothetical protein